MFCPKCGFIMDDDASRCPECGFIIPSKEKKILNEKQTVKKTDANSYLKYTSRRVLFMRIIGIFVSAVIAICYFMPWIKFGTVPTTEMIPSAIISFDWTYDSMSYLKYLPTIIPVLGLIAAAMFVIGAQGWFGAVASICGFTTAILSIVLGLLLPEYELYNVAVVSCSPAVGLYLPMILGFVIFIAGLRCRMTNPYQ